MTHCSTGPLVRGTPRQLRCCWRLAQRQLWRAVDSDGRTPLHLAALNGHSLAAAALLLRAAPGTATAADPDAHLPIHFAAMNGHSAVLQLLLGAAPETAAAVGDEGAYTPLHCAARRGQRAASGGSAPDCCIPQCAGLTAPALNHASCAHRCSPLPAGRGACCQGAADSAVAWSSGAASLC